MCVCEYERVCVCVYVLMCVCVCEHNLGGTLPS